MTTTKPKPLRLTAEERSVLMRALGRQGGEARAKSLSPARRRAIAAKAGQTFAANCRARHADKQKA